MKRFIRLTFAIALLFASFVVQKTYAWEGMRMPELFIKGRYLMAKDINGNDSIVNLHGFGQTYSAYFNGYAWCKDANGNVKWDWNSQHDASACVVWNKRQIANMLKKGWKVNWIRIHMDPHWSNKQGVNTSGESDISAFDFEMFKKNFDKVFYNMADYCIRKGIYVVMRPPGVCPENLKPGDAYQEYLIKVWTYVANHEKVKNNPYIMFELANEPVNMWDGNQYTNGWSDGSYKYHTQYFQKIIDAIRNTGANNILWVPGLCWQQNYQGFVKYPLKGENLGLAVHCYPGWYGSDSEADNGSVEQGIVTKGNTYFDFQAGWDNSLKQVSQTYPILITEMDWSPKKYNSSWGKCNTGVLGGTGFGANFKYIMDKTGNVSWMLFTDADKLAMYNDEAPDGLSFLTDPESCPRPIFRWYEEYSQPGWEFKDNLKESFIEASSKDLVFPGTSVSFYPSINEGGLLQKNSNNTYSYTTFKYTFGGWKFEGGMDMSNYTYLVLNLAEKSTSGDWYLRIYDEDNYSGNYYRRAVPSTTTRLVVNLANVKTTAGTNLQPSHIYMVGLYNSGTSAIKIKNVYLTSNTDYSEPTGIDDVIVDNEGASPLNNGNAIYNVQGQRVQQLEKGKIYIQNGKKIVNL